MERNELSSYISQTPERPGVYIFKDALGVVLYVGKALSLRNRLTSYIQKDAATKTVQMVQAAANVTHIETGAEIRALILEAMLIKLHRPRYNVIFRDDKSYLYIFISTGEQFPKVFLTRRPKNTDEQGTWDSWDGLKGEYFGPFPSAGSVRTLLKKLRRLFPYCQQRRESKRACFYSHLGLCRPCPSTIIKHEPHTLEYKQFKKVYKTSLRRLTQIISGHFEAVRKDLEKEMKIFSENEQYEAAGTVRNQIAHLENLFSERTRPQAFLENPNFYLESQKTAADELLHILVTNEVSSQPLTTIECFDISTIAGQFSVASQVVFVDGAPEKKLYRRYRIKRDGIPNDVAMMREAISRRLTHSEWKFPDLLIVDGGKPQVSTIQALLIAKNSTMPLIGLAKKREQIVIKITDQFKIITLPRSSPALQLIQQIRDEAHRFANTYNRKRRNKGMFE